MKEDAGFVAQFYFLKKHQQFATIEMFIEARKKQFDFFLDIIINKKSKSDLMKLINQEVTPEQLYSKYQIPELWEFLDYHELLHRVKGLSNNE